MQSKCLTPQVVCEAEVTNSTDEELKIYYGLTEANFKERHKKHKTSFNNRDCMEVMELSKQTCSLKDQTKTPHIKWSILK